MTRLCAASFACILPLLLGCREDGLRHYRERLPGVSAAPNPQSLPTRLQWDVPKGWATHGHDGLRLASLYSPDSTVLVTLVELSGPAGEERPNLIRWAGQLGWQTRQADSVAIAVGLTAWRGMTRSGLLLVLHHLESPDRLRGILVASVSLPGSTLFLKASGEAAALKAEAETLAGLARSVRMDSP